MTKNVKILEIVITKKPRQGYLSNFFCITLLEPPIIQSNKIWSEQMNDVRKNYVRFLFPPMVMEGRQSMQSLTALLYMFYMH